MRRGCMQSLTQRHRRNFDAPYTLACGVPRGYDGDESYEKHCESRIIMNRS